MQGMAAVVEVLGSVVNSLHPAALCWHPPSAPPRPFWHPSSVSVSKSRLLSSWMCIADNKHLFKMTCSGWSTYVCDVLNEYFISLCSFLIFLCHLFCLFFLTTVYMPLQSDCGTLSAQSAFYMGKLSPTCSCFKKPYCSSFPSAVDEMQRPAACQHYFCLNLRNWINCHQSWSYFFSFL